MSSLSAILIDENYYVLTQNNTRIIDGLRVATEPLLICLKIKAFIDLSEKKGGGGKVDSRDIKKHRNDVFRLAVTITGEEKMDVPDTIFQDLQKFYEVISNNSPDIKNLLKNMGMDSSISIDDIVEVLKSTFIEK